MAEIATKYDRFKDAPWFPKVEVNVIIGGAGGIGSWLALFLTRAGFMPIVYDFDTYEEHNIGGQLCKSSDIGKPKVLALRDTIQEFTGTEILVYPEKYTNKHMVHDYMFSAFDNMEARKIMFERWKSVYKGNPNAIFIDGRLLMEQIQILCVTGDQTDKYEAYLFDDADVPAETCTLKQTSHSAALIAGMMTASFTNHYTNVVSGNKSRAVPFYREWLLPIDYNDYKDE